MQTEPQGESREDYVDPVGGKQRRMDGVARLVGRLREEAIYGAVVN